MHQECCQCGKKRDSKGKVSSAREARSSTWRRSRSSITRWKLGRTSKSSVRQSLSVRPYQLSNTHDKFGSIPLVRHSHLSGKAELHVAVQQQTLGVCACRRTQITFDSPRIRDSVNADMGRELKMSAGKVACVMCCCWAVRKFAESRGHGQGFERDHPVA